MPTKPTRRNPQDVTLRNVRAARKALTALTARVRVLERAVARLAKAKAKAR